MQEISVKDILSQTCPLSKKYIPDLQQLVALVRKLQAAGYVVGIVGGVWDLLHPGHARYLALAKKECDVLIVVVDSDELVRHRKGPHRPVVPESERIEMLSYLGGIVDIITLRPLSSHVEDREYLNKEIKPDVCILSTSTGDIDEEQRMVIAQNVKRVAVFLPQAETSSSARIRLLAIDGATPLAQSVTELVEGKAEQVAQILATLPQDMRMLIESHMTKLKGI